MPTLARLLVAAFGAAALAACAPYRVYLKGVPPLNPDEPNSKVSTAVEVRIYQLRDKSTFERLPYDVLWADDSQLGDHRLGDPVQKTVRPSNPDEPAIEVLLDPVKDDARYIGIVGRFGEKSKGQPGPQHRAVPRDEAKGATFVLTEYRIDVK